MKNILKKYKIQLKLLFALILEVITLSIMYFFVMPTFLNNSLYLYQTTTQIIFFPIILFFIFAFFTLYKTRFLFKYNDIFTEQKKYKIQEINYVRNKLFTIPYYLFIYNIIAPSVIVTFIHVYVTHVFKLKVFIFILTLITLCSTFVFIYNCNLFKKLLTKLPYNNNIQIKKSTLLKRICFNILPSVTVSILFSSLVNQSIITCSILLIINISILILFSKNLSDDINIIASGFLDITKNKDITNIKHLTITSNDELSNLIISFNKIQQLNKANIKKIQENQDRLMEHERLSSLGQLIGGIAHNLKTPIMSISGATEGLNDLIHEYDLSIDDPEVSTKDHHEIAKEMSTWISKIQDYTQYISDIITTVKGQAVTMSNQEYITFTINELVKRIDILMKHELQNALISLNISIEVNENLNINGDVNNLVQVINNMISNSIQAYNGKINETIEFRIYQENNNIIFSIEDHAGGLPKKVKSKLFKEMVTTKGIHGTGLGLYMSYSTIKAHFNGNITFESETGVGTKFNIIIPLELD